MIMKRFFYFEEKRAQSKIMKCAKLVQNCIMTCVMI